MKRSNVSLEDIADWHNLANAAYRAARGKRQRSEVQAFLGDLNARLTTLQRQILEGSVVVGNSRCFTIHDPKPRIIHAPCFRERVLHHALMAQVGPVLDRALVYDTYACRTGKGTVAAVRRVQQHVRRFPWYGKLDIRAYFASIDHAVLKDKLRQRLKNNGVLALIGKIIESHHQLPGKGLPIGALTSQHVANFYLDGSDRLLLEQCHVAGMVRYMDDVVWWCRSRDHVREVLHAAEMYLQQKLRLTVKLPIQINRSERGVSMCGYRVLPDTVRLSRRRRQRYALARRYWERAYANGKIDERMLQAAYSSALAITAHADAASWRREQLRINPPEPQCQSL
jgi:RNA-directed DNA polymerase